MHHSCCSPHPNITYSYIITAQKATLVAAKEVTIVAAQKATIFGAQKPTIICTKGQPHIPCFLLSRLALFGLYYLLLACVSILLCPCLAP